MIYDYLIAIDFSQENMAIAYAKKGEAKVETIESRPTITGLKYFLLHLEGTKVLTFEESTSAHYLYCELYRYVDRIIVCDPYHNSLLGKGPKTDRLDAVKLLKLLRNDSLRSVYHSFERFYDYRRLMSLYEDVVKEGVRWKNRLSAYIRGAGGIKALNKYCDKIDDLCMELLFKKIESNDIQKKELTELFRRLVVSSKQLSALKSIPGIGDICAMKIAATVVNPDRFPSRGYYWAYCGLVRHQKISGDRSYGYRRPRYNSKLKSVYKTAALAAIFSKSNNALKQYYEYLISTCGKPEHIARHMVARKIAEVSLSILRSGQRFRAIKLTKKIREGERSLHVNNN
jgi:hypothetical protein